MISSAKEFFELRTSSSPADQLRASTEAAEVRVWLQVISTYPDLKEWVALNKTVPIEILEILALDPDHRVRSTVADKRKLTATLRRTLAADVEASVRARVACNKKTELEILQLLSNDPEPLVRAAAVRRLNRDHPNENC